MVPCAFLRVFEPLEAFPAADRRRWSRYVARGDGLTVRAALHTESRFAASRLLTRRVPVRSELALVRRVAQRAYVCPLQIAERQAVALLAFRETVPEPAVDAFVSHDEARAAVVALQRLERPPHIQAACWEVPLHWFVAFDPRERHLSAHPEGSGPRLTYLTTAAAALGRLDRVIGVVEATLQDADGIVGLLTDLVDRLAHFHDDSLLELDYGGLAELIAAPDLVTDTTCQELWTAIDALDRGDAAMAAAGYEAAHGRWQHLRDRLPSN